MFVRPFQLADYVRITDLFQTVLSEGCYKDTMKAFAKQLSLDPELVLVSEVDHEVSGIIIGTMDHKNQGYYYRLAVAPAYQRKGIGKQLINELRRKFTQRKVSKILVTVDVHNEPILPVYEAVGYSANDFARSYKHLRIVSG